MWFHYRPCSPVYICRLLNELPIYNPLKCPSITLLSSGFAVYSTNSGLYRDSIILHIKQQAQMVKAHSQILKCTKSSRCKLIPPSQLLEAKWSRCKSRSYLGELCIKPTQQCIHTCVLLEPLRTMAKRNNLTTLRLISIPTLCFRFIFVIILLHFVSHLRLGCSPARHQLELGYSLLGQDFESIYDNPRLLGLFAHSAYLPQ